MPNTPVTPTRTVLGGRNYLSVVDLDIGTTTIPGQPARVGSGVYLGNGIILTAAHNVVLDNSTVDSGLWIGQSIGVSFADGTNWRLDSNMDGDFNDPNDIRGNIDLPTFGISTVSTNNFGNWRGINASVNQGNDLALLRVNTSQLSDVPANQLIIFSDPNEAIGQVWMAGYPNLNLGAEIMYETSGSLIGGDYLSVGANNVWQLPPGTTYNSAGGQSGAGVWLTYDPDGATGSVPAQHYLAGIHSGLLSGSNTPFVEPIGDAYIELGTQLATIFGTNFGSMFATNVLIADADGNVTPIVQGTGFNEDIYVNANASVNYTINAGGGRDTVFYTGLTGTITATIGATNTTVAHGAFTDTLNGVEFITGTTRSDAINIVGLTAGTVRMINGGSTLATPQELPSTKSATVSEALAGGGRLLSAAQIAALAFKETGVVFNHEDQDTVTIGQALLDAGAMITYYSPQGEGVVRLNGVQIGYRGIFHEPGQNDFFGGIPVGGLVTLTDIGDTLLDLSGVVGAVTNALLSGISVDHLGLVDTIATAGDAILDLGALGIDIFNGGDGVDDIIGGVLDDIFTGNGGDDILSGGAGSDTLDGGDGADTLSGGAGDDVLIGGAGADVFDGGAGLDTADYSGAGALVWADLQNVVGGMGDAAGDTFTGVETLIGSAFNDRLYGDAGDNGLVGGAGNDSLFGRNGADMMDGGFGNDFLSGGNGDDVLLGGAGNDQLFGNAGDDMLFGGDGDDLMTGGVGGADMFDGGAGLDRVQYTGGTVGLGVIASLANAAANTGDAAGDTYVGVENLYGTSWEDRLFGDSGDNRLDGLGGDDRLYGAAGDDFLVGAAGDDLLVGGSGNDKMVGGAGADVFEFASLHASKLVGRSPNNLSSGQIISVEGHGYGAAEGAMISFWRLKTAWILFHTRPPGLAPLQS